MCINLIKNAILAQLKLPTIRFFQRNSLDDKTNRISGRVLFGTLAGISFLLSVPSGNIFGIGVSLFFTYKCIRSQNKKNTEPEPSKISLLYKNIKDTFENFFKKISPQPSLGPIRASRPPRLYPVLE